MVVVQLEGALAPAGFVRDAVLPFLRAAGDDPAGWEAALRTGGLRLTLYPDALRALRRWRAAGWEIALTSALEPALTRTLLACAPQGDLTSGFVDVLSADPARWPGPPGRAVVGDAALAEAAEAAGWEVTRLRRPAEGLDGALA